MINQVKTTVLLAALTALILLIGSWLGGSGDLILAFGFAVFMNVGAYWYSDKIVLHAYHAQPVSETQAPEIHALFSTHPPMKKRISRLLGLAA